MKKRRKKSSGLFHDFTVILFSVLVAVMLVKTHGLMEILIQTSSFSYLNTFFAGFFFTSVFTTAPAIVVLGELSVLQPLIITAFVGAVGAVCGDFIIFHFVRDRLSVHLVEIFRTKSLFKRYRSLMRHRAFHGLTFFLGGLIIASPLPDELGLSLLGLSKMRTDWFVAFSFCANFAGIILIGLTARALV